VKLDLSDEVGGLSSLKRELYKLEDSEKQVGQARQGGLLLLDISLTILLCLPFIASPG
jgi:hypothetical protein